MAHSLSAKKRVRQNTARQAVNRWRKRQYRTAITQYRDTLLHGTVEDAQTQLRALCRMLDQIAAKGTLHRNTVSRYKSRLTQRLNARKAATAAAPAA
ncbi:MAG: 30S ribosomal protein S20 [Phycisphaeraceae bacterium]|nr:30S ribosomal protein S20 [Phycisphaeraceae bacterium]